MAESDGSGTDETARPSPVTKVEPLETAPAAEAAPVAPETKPATSDRPGFPIVGIGASAGGLAAFEAFFSAIPADTHMGMAFVLVQHLAPDHSSILTELVGRYTQMKVREVQDGMVVQADSVYIIPPNRDMALLNGTLQLMEPSAPHGLRLPIDYFFRSLAQDQRERAVCVVLSGTGSDGTLGLRAVKGEGGLAIAQEPASADHDGMPRSAIATGLVDYILPPAQMPAQLISYLNHALAQRLAGPEALQRDKADVLAKVCVVLRARTGHDFAQYKENTILRRVERRMAIHEIARMEDYVRFLREAPAESEALLRDLLIGVTSFFRDPEAFAALERAVIPRLFAGRPAGAPVRVWVCGCSTGEEAYSIAMLMQEHIETLKKAFSVQIFATDVDGRAIAVARTGLYPSSIAADVPPERLARFFTEEPGSGGFRVQKAIRDTLICSEQDVVRDPPFSRLDMVSCRNLLIYMKPELQLKLMQLFHYALNAEGVLFLGTSESVGESAGLFGALDRKEKLFVRLVEASRGVRRDLNDFVPPLATSYLPRPPRERRRLPGTDLGGLTQRALLDHYVRAGLLVNGRGDILHIVGRTGRYLEPSSGNAAMNILSMAREGLRRELGSALHRAVARKEVVRYPGLRVKTNGDHESVDLTVRPVSEILNDAETADLYLVVLEEAQESPVEAATALVLEAGSDGAAAAVRVTALEQEVRAKDEYLQTMLEEMETSNEELRSTNEEMQSVNEELRSTNEELETAKEELQSVNEELATVNAELQTKVVDLSRTNNDMNNLLAGTGVGTLFVDSQARIVRFTPAATKVVNLIESDVGRPVGHVVTNLVGYDRLADDVRAVVDTLAPRETEVQTTDGVWFTMRIRPYRTLENIIEGAVITFSDVTDRKRAEERARRLALLVERNANPVVEMDYDGSIHFINEAARLLFPDLQSHAAGAHRWLPERAWVADHFERGLEIWATREVTVDTATYQQDVFALPESRRLRIYGLDITDRPMTADQARGRP